MANLKFDLVTFTQFRYFFLKNETIYAVYTICSILCALIEICTKNSLFVNNNFLIFRTSFSHFINQQDLYTPYPKEYDDVFLYGPVFAMMMYFFHFMSTTFGVIVWNFINAITLVFGVYKLPFLEERQKSVALLLMLNSAITSFLNVQSHGLLIGMILFAYSAMLNNRVGTAAFFTVLGTLMKPYGIISCFAIAFFQNVIPKYSLYCFLWSIVILSSLCIFTSHGYIIDLFQKWFEALTRKDFLNTDNLHLLQDYSVMGVIRRSFKMPHLSSLYFCIPVALILTAVLILMLKKKSNVQDNNLVLNVIYILLITVNVCSSGTEASTLLYSFCAISLWISNSLNWNSYVNRVVFFTAFVITSLGPTDFMPDFFEWNLLRPYSILIIPPFLIWLLLIKEVGLKLIKTSFNRE